MTVSANVELQKELRRHEEKVTVDPKTVTISTQERSTTSTTKGPEPNGRPGLQNQGGVPNTGAVLAGSSKGSESSEESSESQSQNVVSHGTTDIDIAPLTPKRVTVAVGIPSSYFESIWRSGIRRPPARSPSRSTMPPSRDRADPNRGDRQDQEPTSSPWFRCPPRASIRRRSLPSRHSRASPRPTCRVRITDKALSWVGAYWSTAGMIGVALVSLLMLRSMIRSGAVAVRVNAPVRCGSPTNTRPSRPNPWKPPKSRFKRKLGSGPSLRDELADIVREDPDAAANILRGWIGNVS